LRIVDRVELPKSWQNGDVNRLPAIEVGFSVRGLLLTWRINDNEIMSSMDDDEARFAASLSQLVAEGRAFLSWREAAAYVREHYPAYSDRFLAAVAPLLASEAK
jgi:hypothetical protein